MRAAWRPAAVFGSIVCPVKGPHTGAAQYGGGDIPADLLRRDGRRAAELAAWRRAHRSALRRPSSIRRSHIGHVRWLREHPIHNLGEAFTSKGMTYAGGPAFQWNILNYGQITNNVRLQDARLQQLLVDYQNTVLNAQQQVDTGFSTLLHAATGWLLAR